MHRSIVTGNGEHKHRPQTRSVRTIASSSNKNMSLERQRGFLVSLLSWSIASLDQAPISAVAAALLDELNRYLCVPILQTRCIPDPGSESGSFAELKEPG